MWSRFGVFFSQPSTWRGLTVLLSVLGVQLAPEHAEAIVTAGATAVGALGMLLSDSDKSAPPLTLDEVVEEGRK